MPRNWDLIIHLPGFEVVEVLEESPCTLRVMYRGEVLCPHCGGKQLRVKDCFERKIRHQSIGLRHCVLLLKAYKYQCRLCFRYFHSRFPGILPYQRASELFREEICEKHHQGIAQSTLCSRYGMGHATVERWYHRFLFRAKAERENQNCPRVLGIDEHFFSKKQGYATTVADLSKQRVFDVALGRSEKALEPFLRSLKSPDRTRVVLMDLCETFRSIARKYFPNALIVADRFHVIRLVNHSFLEAWRHFDPGARGNRGLLSLMRRHEWHLKEAQRANLQTYFQSKPALEAIYHFKQKLARLLLLKERTQAQCRKLIPWYLHYIEQLRESPLSCFQTLGKTLQRWKEEIARMWRFTKTNSITEGLHNKMELISRRAYGFRNFQNYRLRVKVLCG